MTPTGPEGTDREARLRFWRRWSALEWGVVGIVGLRVLLGLLLYRPGGGPEQGGAR